MAARKGLMLPVVRGFQGARPGMRDRPLYQLFGHSAKCASVPRQANLPLKEALSR
jgi:hypothetical protein